MKAFVIVSAPFHLICLTEAIEIYQIEQFELVFHGEIDSENERQMNQVFTKLPIKPNKTHFLRPSEIRGKTLEYRIEYYAGVLNKTKRVEFDLVLFSDFRAQWQKDLIDGFLDARRVLLDDGSITLALIEFHLKSGFLFSLPRYGTQNRQAYATQLKKKYGIKPMCDADIELFTIFGAADIGHRVITRNSLSHLHRQFQSIDEKTEVIIGAKIVERGFCTKSEYFDLLDEICLQCDEKNVIYIPHRGESLEQKQYIKDRYPYFKVLQLSCSIEFWLGSLDRPPAIFHGYVSTAFFIINTCYPQITLKCYRPPEVVIDNMASAPVYGSDQYNYSEVTRLLYDKLPKEVTVVQL